MNNDGLVLAVDFDGTVVDHRYPDVGRDVPDAVRVLKKAVEAGHKLILWTMRSGEPLKDAIKWYEDREIPLFGIQRNPDQDSWTDSPKAYANKYIDDAAVGAPLIEISGFNRLAIDWEQIEILLKL